MKQIAIAAVAVLSVLALSGCGHSDSAGDSASADNVEMPAEEAISGVNAAATPAPDAGANATEAASGGVNDAAGAAADAAASVDAAASGASAAQ